MELGELTKFITSLGVLGTLAILLIYLFHTYIPRLQADFKEALRESHDTNARQQREFLEALKAERHTHAAALNGLVLVQQETKRAIENQTTALVSALRLSR